MTSRVPGAPLAAAALVVLLAGCTSFAAGRTPAAGDPAGTPAAEEPAGPQGVSCPADRAEPDPDRPRIELDFRLEDDRRTVTGTQTVVFTPDLPTDELVFRLVPNAPDTAAAGNGLVVDDVAGEDVDGSGYEDAGASGPGGLFVVGLDDELEAGESTEVTLAFTLTLGEGAFDRVGADDDSAWWASGAPLLAWEPGVGWARDPFVGLIGETASSPVSDVRLRVSAPEDLTVLMTGDQEPPTEPRDGRRVWTSTEPVARDVSVAAGAFTTTERTTPGGVRVTLGVLPDPDLPLERLADWTVQAMADLEEHFGPFPYGTLTVPSLRSYGGGIEYPSSILMAAPDRGVLVHEVAHMYFYGMVGNSQFRDPWLDEAFATYGEAVLDDPTVRLAAVLAAPGDVGATMADFAGSREYFGTVYDKGGAALLAARTAAGTAAFDAAIRCYVDAYAWTTATPEDLAAVLADLPKAVSVLVDAQALDPEDLLQPQD